jgi:hypothetical protein
MCAVVAVLSRVKLNFGDFLHGDSLTDELAGEHELIRQVWVVGKCVEAIPLPNSYY